MVAELPEDPHNPPPLDLEYLTNYLLADSDLWELGRFGCDEKWATDPETRRAIAFLHLYDRANEELDILSSECQRYVHWHCL
jgi:hypothetical protein